MKLKPSPLVLFTVLGIFVAILATIGAVDAQVASFNTLPTPSVTSTKPKPNIILVNTDDASIEQINHGLPNLRAFFETHGVIFDETYIADPLCCPSRSSLFTGLYAHNHGIKYNEYARDKGGARGFRERGLENSTIATWLQEAGYTTSLVGKYLNEYDLLPKNYIPPGWNDWHAIHDNGYYHFSLSENGELIEYGNGVSLCHEVMGDDDGPGGGTSGNGDCPISNDYSTDILRDKALTFLRGTTPSNPFFLYFAPIAPHEPSIPPLRYKDVAVTPHAHKPNYYGDRTGKPNWILSQKFDEERAGELDLRYEDGVRSLLAVDQAVMEFIEQLRADGRLSNTVIIFTNDNGFATGEWWWNGKRCPYDECLRVPLAIYYPALIKFPRVDHHLISHIDITSTIVDLAGAVAKTPVNGKSLRRLLTSSLQNTPFREAVFSESWANNKTDDTSCTSTARTPCDAPSFQTVITPLFKYTKLGSGEEELYDRRVDIHELKNLAHDSSYGEVLTYLRGLLQQMAAE